MSDATVPGVTVARPGAARGRRRRQGPTAGQERTRRITVAVVLLVSAIALVAANHAVRGLEAQLFAPLAGLFVPTGGTGTTGSILYVALGRSSAFGLRITDECTTTVLIVPVLVVVAAFALMRSIPLRRVAMSLAVAVGCLLAVNAVRIAVVAFSTFHWGEEGFRVAHVLIGSAFALCGFALALVLAIRVLVRGGRATTAR